MALAGLLLLLAATAGPPAGEVPEPLDTGVVERTGISLMLLREASVAFEMTTAPGSGR